MAGPVGNAMTTMLVTRPEPDTQVTLAKLNALGIDGVAAPVMVRETLNVSLPAADGFAAMVLTSTNALRALEDRGELAEFLGLPVLAVGDRTAREAEQAGFAKVSSAAGTARDLVNAIVISGLKGPLFHPTAKHQSADLAKALAPHGVMVVAAKVYDMVAVDRLPDGIVPALGQGIDAVLSYSRRSSEIFAGLAGELAGPERRKLACLCLSETVAEPLLEARFSRISLADRPDDEAMMTLALAFAREQTGQ
jgi:uroporphyrinogen-III synthase